jgi:hypothetical protein
VPEHLASTSRERRDIDIGASGDGNRGFVDVVGVLKLNAEIVLKAVVDGGVPDLLCRWMS